MECMKQVIMKMAHEKDERRRKKEKKEAVEKRVQRY